MSLTSLPFIRSLHRSLFAKIPTSISLSQSFGTILALFFGYLTIYVLRPSIHAYRSPLRVLPGPPRGRLWDGVLHEMHKESIVWPWYRRTIRQHGHVFKYHLGLGAQRLFTVDPKALNHVLTNSFVWQKPAAIRKSYQMLLGDGPFSAEGFHHKRQRKVVSPSFSTSHLRDLTPIFVSKSHRLREVLLEMLSADPSAQTTRLDIYFYITRATLDMIGLAGFNYSFRALDDQADELAEAYTACMHPPEKPTFWHILKFKFPILRRIFPSKDWFEAMEIAQKKLMSTAKELVEKGQKEMLTGDDESKNGSEDWTHVGSETTHTHRGKDLLSRLIKANSEETDEKQRLSDYEVASQIVTFLVAGHETSATAVTWIMLSIATNEQVQTRLREEIQAMGIDSPTMDELNSLPYLDAVIREGLRLHCIVNAVARVAEKDDILPLEKPFVDRNGQTRNHIEVKKGDSIYISMLIMNTLESIWGADAEEFNPDRWFALPEAAHSIPGVWGNQLTFIGGPRSCVGFAFAIIEMKALLYVLIKDFVFELAVPKEDIIVRQGLIARPSVKGEKEDQLPVLVRRAT